MCGNKQQHKYLNKKQQKKREPKNREQQQQHKGSRYSLTYLEHREPDDHQFNSVY